MPRQSYVPFIPDEMVATSTLYVAFNAFGPGHYDGTRPTTLQEQGKFYFGLNISKKKALLEGFLGTGRRAFKKMYVLYWKNANIKSRLYRARYSCSLPTVESMKEREREWEKERHYMELE